MATYRLLAVRLPLLLLVLLLVALPPTLSSPVPASRFWLLAWSDHKMTVLASVPASSRTECGVRCARRQGCAAASFDPSSASLPCRLLACQTSWVGFDGQCYWLATAGKNFLEARIICTGEQQSVLASIHSGAENDFVKSLAESKGVDRLYLGLSRANSNPFQWEDASPVDYLNWGAGEGSDSTVFFLQFFPFAATLIASQGGTWADNLCLDVYPYLCKRSRVLP
ncbi:regenerating islet-derived protein 3-gamma-like [Amphibalanus amphitrite]|uniref:regenerating islet-derived protein 3-gamma-like n=1 Tax=Amphibalanus amphitrite TaxID=1232801 RepID=UPI001C921990|nr:regenerating islet-derived protein 3-gamma-like [Amphibalanus amphitrite]